MKLVTTGTIFRKGPVDIVHVEAFRVTLNGLLQGRSERNQIVNGLICLQQSVVFDIFQLLDSRLHIFLAKEILTAFVTNAVYLFELVAQNVLQ